MKERHTIYIMRTLAKIMQNKASYSKFCKIGQSDDRLLRGLDGFIWVICTFGKGGLLVGFCGDCVILWRLFGLLLKGVLLENLIIFKHIWCCGCFDYWVLEFNNLSLLCTLVNLVYRAS